LTLGISLFSVITCKDSKKNGTHLPFVGKSGKKKEKADSKLSCTEIG
jgi:hypothetical protein